MITTTLLDVVERYRHCTALVTKTQILSYQQLYDEALTISHRLSQAGFGKGHLIALYSDRSAATISCLIATLFNGCAYTIIEEEQNREENCHRLCLVNPDLVICHTQHIPFFEKAGLRVLSYCNLCQPSTDPASLAEYQHQLPPITTEDTAYVLYTSGSTGQPKGVNVSHGNIDHYVSAVRKALKVKNELHYAHLSTLSADLGNTSLLLSLYSGGCLHLIDGEIRKDPRQLSAYFKQHNIQFLKITPSHWQALFSVKSYSKLPTPTLDIPPLDYLVFGGEILQKSLVKEVFNRKLARNVFNHYGPTETTIGVTAFPITREIDLEHIKSEIIPIGKPLGSTQILVCDHHQHFHSINARGELYIGGPSVAQGYRHLPESTAKKFQYLSFSNNEPSVFYRTGDIVKVDQDGLLHFIGRIDRQVKVMGNRIELEQIENILRTLCDVDDAVVIQTTVNNKQSLVVAILNHRNDSFIDKIRNKLISLAPSYMIPDKWISMKEFPRNANGKVHIKRVEEKIILQLKNEEVVNEETIDNTYELSNYGDDERILYTQIKTLFQKFFSHNTIQKNDNFFELGGNSLDAIQLIAEMQHRGFDISVHAFTENPTIDGLTQVLKNRQKDKPSSRKSTTEHSKISNFSAAQTCFFRQNLANPDHHNQTVFFSINSSIQQAHLCQALHLISEHHPLLRTRYYCDKTRWQAKLLPHLQAPVLSTSLLEANMDQEAIEALIDTTANNLQTSLSLQSGKVFKAHLFTQSTKQHYLLLVAHHLCVDVVSWRIIIGELSRLYASLIDKALLKTQAPQYSFWDWVDHLDNYHRQSEKSVNTTLSDIKHQNIGHSFLSTLPHTELETQSYWFGYSIAETQTLNIQTKALNIPLHLFLLGSFAHHLGKTNKTNTVVVDIESHGRLTLDNSIDISRIVGWHTATFPLQIPIHQQSLTHSLQSTLAAYEHIDDLGVSRSLQIKHKTLTAANDKETLPAQHSSVCFNFLGDTNFNHDDRLPLKPCPFKTGQSRGPKNQRNHTCKISARIVNDQLLVDLSFFYKKNHPESIKWLQIAHDLRATINSQLPKTSSCMPPIIEAGAQTGQIHYAPKALLQALPSQQTTSRQEQTYNHVLLTGATGFLGIYCLRELLSSTKARITCLVRPTSTQSGQDRLQETFAWYFPQEQWEHYAHRITVLNSDLKKPLWDLEESYYQELSHTIDAIYHFAADTRLLGADSDFINTNITPLRQLITFAKTKREKDLHYMSTLAVCGVNPEKEPIVFSENTLDIGQKFQNGYEHSKFKAEQLLNQFIIEGHRGYIYRTGNVSGDSTSGRFQRNAKDNRLVQFLNACCKLGLLPSDLGEAIALSPVDIVTSGVVALSLDYQSPPGVYHIDNGYSIPISALFDALKHHKIRFSQSRCSNFSALFHSFSHNTDPDIALGKFWSSRQLRNIQYNHQKTEAKLKKLGHSFHQISQQWLIDFVGQLLVNKAIYKTKQQERKSA